MADYVQLPEDMLASGRALRTKRLTQGDMITTDDAASIANVSRVTINAWIKDRKCIALEQMRRGWKLPSWQFEPWIWNWIPGILQAMDGCDGWTILTFLEQPTGALDGASPIQALMTRAATGEQVIALAKHQASV